MASPSTPAIRAQSARELLLQAAREELAERGHAGVGLRAVARRAGLSHAAPAHFFIDRAGLLTAVATEGFLQLTERLDREAATTADPQHLLAALGRVYVDFGLDNSALVDLMFRRSELHPDDPALLEAQTASIGRLIAAVAGSNTGRRSREAPLTTTTGDGAQDLNLALVSWALVHGLVALAREGVLAGPGGRADGDSAAVARDLVTFYTTALLEGERTTPRS